jgi:hypothetical protein
LKKKLIQTFGDGTTEKVFMILSGYSSRIFEMRRVPIPDPVPPPREWVSCSKGFENLSVNLYLGVQEKLSSLGKLST